MLSQQSNFQYYIDSYYVPTEIYFESGTKITQVASKRIRLDFSCLLTVSGSICFYFHFILRLQIIITCYNDDVGMICAAFESLGLSFLTKLLLVSERGEVVLNSYHVIS